MTWSLREKEKNIKKVFFSEEGKRQEEVQKKKRKPEEVMNEDKKNDQGGDELELIFITKEKDQRRWRSSWNDWRRLQAKERETEFF